MVFAIGVHRTAAHPIAEVARPSREALAVQERLQVPFMTVVCWSAPCADARLDNRIKK
jgi:hypothetical protein